MALYDQYHIWDFVKDAKAKGLIKHYGFSFHGTPQLLDELLTKHPDVEFVQLQLNYADWENPAITSRANYEIARKHQKSIVVMEPIKGGTLASPPESVREILHCIMGCTLCGITRWYYYSTEWNEYNGTGTR